MSIESWTQEFYPYPANSAEAHERAIDHSLQKWIGLRPENLARHALSQAAGGLYDVGSSYKGSPLFQIDAGSCALCSVYYDSSADYLGPEDSDEWEAVPECRECPLSKARGGVPCDHCMGSEKNSPYGKGTVCDPATPEPMILWLLKAKEEVENNTPSRLDDEARELLQRRGYWA